MLLINAHLLRLKSGDLAGELEEASLDLEASRRKLTTLRSQDSMLSGPPTPSATPTGKKFEFLDGVVGPEKLSKQARELEAGLEEAKVSSTPKTLPIPTFKKIRLDLFFFCLIRISYLGDLSLFVTSVGIGSTKVK